MGQGIGAAARLPGSGCKNLAIHALAGSERVSDLAVRHGVSRKFVYQQTHKARAALDDAFSPATPDQEVLFERAVTNAWLRQVIVALVLIGRSSYRGVVEFLRDLLGVAVSVGCVHDVLETATRQASTMRSSRVPHRCWPASMPGRPTATFSPRRTAATWTPGACTCWTPPSRDCGPTTPPPMPGRAYGPAEGGLG